MAAALSKAEDRSARGATSGVQASRRQTTWPGRGGSESIGPRGSTRSAGTARRAATAAAWVSARFASHALLPTLARACPPRSNHWRPASVAPSAHSASPSTRLVSASRSTEDVQTAGSRPASTRAASAVRPIWV